MEIAINEENNTTNPANNPPPYLPNKIQLGQLIMYCTTKKVLPFAFFNLPGLQNPVRNRRDLRFDTYEWKQTKKG